MGLFEGEGWVGLCEGSKICEAPSLACLGLLFPSSPSLAKPLPTDDLFKVHKLKPNLKWRQAFEIYLKSMPPYFLLVRLCLVICSE